MVHFAIFELVIVQQPEVGKHSQLYFASTALEHCQHIYDITLQLKYQ